MNRAVAWRTSHEAGGIGNYLLAFGTSDRSLLNSPTYLAKYLVIFNKKLTSLRFAFANHTTSTIVAYI